MVEMVECGECGSRYDSDVDAFCSRCGSTKTGATIPRSLDVARRGGMVRRRVQAGGVMLITIGVLALVGYTVIAAAPGFVLDNMEVFLADQAGGEIAVHVFQDGSPVAGQAVTFFHADGYAVANLTTDSAGWANATAPVAYVDVMTGNVTRTVISLPEATTVLEVDLDAAATSDERVGLEAVVSAVRGVSGFFAVMSLFVVAGGIAALRVRGRGLALGGAALGLLPALILFVATPTGGVALLLVVTGTAFALVYSGRREF